MGSAQGKAASRKCSLCRAWPPVRAFMSLLENTPVPRRRGAGCAFLSSGSYFTLALEFRLPP